MPEPADRTTLDRLVLRYLPETLRFATRLTADPDTAEDIVQEALARVLEKWQSFRGEADFRTWLFRIVLNVFYDRTRRLKISEPLPDEVPDNRSPGVAEQVLAGELDSQIAKAIGNLPPRQHEVLILVSCEGFSLGEAAEILQISESKASASLYVARQTMSKALRPYLNPIDESK